MFLISSSGEADDNFENSIFSSSYLPDYRCHKAWQNAETPGVSNWLNLSNSAIIRL